MKFERSSGVLLHPTSLPGPYGIGDLGPGARRWVEWLAGTGCGLWQVLPLGPTGYGDSPYQCFSSMAGNPYLISPELLLEQGLLEGSDLLGMPGWDPARVDFGALYQWKPALLAVAFRRFEAERGPLGPAYDSFRAEAAAWLEDFALFMAIKEQHGGGAWNLWPEELRQREPAALRSARASLADQVRMHIFNQFLFDQQWGQLRSYTHSQGLKIIGDLPIFVAYDSADVWVHPELFHLDPSGRPTVVAGVPPDYFSPQGQLWGNPLYRWEDHKKLGYAWWIERIRHALSTVDILRIDHFRGFAGYWEIPGQAATAEQGRWAAGPGADFFETVLAGLGDLPIIAEDLGEITPDVITLRDRFSLPGMKILQFAFSGPDNPFLPHRYGENCIVYTGTHDNDSALGWYASAPEAEKAFARRYLRSDGTDFAWDLIRAAWSSTAVFALTPLQDLLRLDGAARMNYPSRLGGNWEWRMGSSAMSAELQAALQELNWLFERSVPGSIPGNR